MDQSAIVHEWFDEAGPDTFEYLLPCRDVNAEHARLFDDWIGRFANQPAPEAQRDLTRYLDDFESAEIAAITRLFRGLAPHSVVVHRECVWLLCKSPELLHEPSGHGNMLLLPPPNEHENWPNALTAEEFHPLRRLLHHFGGMAIDIPPTCGLVRPHEMQPAVEDKATFAWKNIGSWEGSFPVYDVASGDTVLVRADGRYGRWSHELTDPVFVERLVREHSMTKPDDGAVIRIGDFDDFIAYVAAESGIAGD